jgi:hypothetical protein
VCLPVRPGRRRTAPCRVCWAGCWSGKHGAEQICRFCRGAGLDKDSGRTIRSSPL